MIHRTDKDGVVVLEMRHGKANAIDLELFEHLGQALDLLEHDPRPIVLTGQGQMFSAGVDLFRVLEGGEEYLQDFLPALSNGLKRLFTWPAPVVAAINGHAIAGGCILAAACDLRLMNGEAGKIGVTELLVGAPFPVVALEVLRYALPTHHLETMVKGGQLLAAAEAKRIGLVDEVIDGAELLDRAHLEAQRLGAITPRCFALTKRHLRAPAIEKMERLAGLDTEVHYIWTDDTTLEGIRKFLERTVGRK